MNGWTDRKMDGLEGKRAGENKERKEGDSICFVLL